MKYKSYWMNLFDRRTETIIVVADDYLQHALFMRNDCRLAEFSSIGLQTIRNRRYFDL